MNRLFLQPHYRHKGSDCKPALSRDIGMYESCLFGCRYCYATKNFEQAKANFDSHHPDSPSMLRWHEAAR